MNIQDFERVLKSFADSASDVSISRGKLTAFIRGDAIEAQILNKEGVLYIEEDGNEMKAVRWISMRLAQLEQLADRIKEYIIPIKNFINPSGKLLADLDNDPTETDQDINNISKGLRQSLGKEIPGTTSVIYLTSDAGEGKTTIINHFAIEQAELFKKKETHWLLVPIPLGGRPFLRFDDIVIASLVNRLRFRLFYYESFIELVRLGLIVPAFDGFEEMFMESSPNEALSATGNLMTKLSSEGNVLIAARKAYFDYKSFSSQAKLFDTIGNNSVAFSKVSINRWNKEQFIEYASSKGVIGTEEIYRSVANSLGSETHPLLTRPVLVSKLLDVVHSTDDLARVTTALNNSTEYFPNFVNAIIVREAESKWIDTSGEPYKPLIAVSEHYDLLSMIAEEMWLNSTDSLPINIFDLLADLYSESKSLNVRISRQVRERLKQHALIVKSDQNSNYLKFDHEEFQEFFLGIAFFNQLRENKLVDFKNLMRKSLIFGQTVDAIVSYCKRKELPLKNIIHIFDAIQANEGPTSFIKENSGKLIIKIISSEDCKGEVLSNYIFPINSLVGINLKNVIIKNSHFQTTDISGLNIINCLFENCTFDGIELGNSDFTVMDTVMKNCEVSSVQNVLKDLSFYDPSQIKAILHDNGFEIHAATEEIPETLLDEIVKDDDLEIVERALRRFIRGSQINDSVFRIRLGQNAEYFIQTLLPVLEREQVITEVTYQGAGQKRRFKLGIPFDKINVALQESKGSFPSFLEQIRLLK